MCPNCRAFISITDRVCPYCNVQLGPRAVDLRATRFAASLLPRANVTAVVFIIINIAFFLAELVVNHQLTREPFGSSPNPLVLILFGAKAGPPYLPQCEWWRLITAGFLHAGFLHIGMNCWALFVLIGEVEQFYGTSRTVVAYIFSTYLGFLFSLLWSPRVVSLGASAACYGLIGIMLAMGLRRRADPLTQAVRAYYRQWLIFGLVLSLIPGIDMAAHIGGFVGGFLVGFAGGLPGLPNSPREILWKALAVAAVAIALYAFVQDFRSYHVLLRQL